MMDDNEFRFRSDEALARLQRSLETAADLYDFDVDRDQGALSIEFTDPPAKFVISPNSPVKQIWVSARVKSFKLDWDDARSEFVLAADGNSLRELMAAVVSEQLQKKIDL